MAFPTALTNPNPSDIANLNPEVIGTSPAIAMGNYYLSTSTALSLAALNAVNQQQQSWTFSNTVLSLAIDDMRDAKMNALSADSQEQTLA